MTKVLKTAETVSVLTFCVTRAPAYDVTLQRDVQRERTVIFWMLEVNLSVSQKACHHIFSFLCHVLIAFCSAKSPTNQVHL